MMWMRRVVVVIPRVGCWRLLHQERGGQVSLHRIGGTGNGLKVSSGVCGVDTGLIQWGVQDVSIGFVYLDVQVCFVDK